MPSIIQADQATKLYKEIQVAKQNHFFFDVYRIQALAQVNRYPHLTVSQGYCVVVRDKVKDRLCDKIIADLLIKSTMPLVPYDSTPILIERDDGILQPAMNGAGLPVFERDSKEDDVNF